MALQDRTNFYRTAGSYTPSCILPPKYKPVICRGQRSANQPSRVEFPAMRLAGNCNIDLWLDGQIYPKHPVTQKTPEFHDLKSFLCFLGDGLVGFYGYVCSLHNGTDVRLREYMLRCSELTQEVQELMIERNASIEQLLADKIALQNVVASSESQVSLLLSNMHDLETGYEEQISHLRAEIAAHVEDKKRHMQESNVEVNILIANNTEQIRRIQVRHEEQIRDLKLELLKTKNNLEQLRLKCGVLKNPLMQQATGRKRKDLSDLSSKGGHARRVKQAIRYLLQLATVTSIQNTNASTGSRKRICGLSGIQKSTAAVFADILTKGEAAAMMEAPKLHGTSINIASDALKSIRSEVGPHEILAVCDRSGVSHKGYTAIYKTSRTGIRHVDPRLTQHLLPNPHQVGLLRTEMNSNLSKYVGDYYHINNSMELPPDSDRKQGPKQKPGPIHLHLNESNTLFVDLETVMKSMVLFYKFTPAELNGAPLIFVLKMDEAEIVKQQKLERLGISIMNRALNPDITQNNPNFFSVQSDTNIWPIATFRVIKESHACLKWVLNQTTIPGVIKCHSNGQKLVDDSVGEFAVEWHLACDMKTIKCLFGMSHGPTAKHPCIYCWQEWIQAQVLTTTQAASIEKAKRTWNGGLFSTSIANAPVRGSDGTGLWDPILDIPLSRVHICMLHAQCRIMEKIIHLHLCYVWNLKDPILRREAISAMEHALSKGGIAGGSVILTKDPKLSGKNSDLPSKLSLNGASCRRIFKPSSWSNMDQTWKDICEAERNTSNQGRAKRERQNMWTAFADLRIYFTSMNLSHQQKIQYKSKVEKWGRLFLKAFGESQVTHYVHCMVKHSTWFVDTYGSLAIWSTQGMEKSHYTAKSAFHKHTQHSGTSGRRSAIIQTYEWWFRTIQHREYELKSAERMLQSNSDPAIDHALTVERRRQSSLSSSALTKHAEWRQRRIRIGSTWAPNPLFEHHVEAQTYEEIDQQEAPPSTSVEIL